MTTWILIAIGICGLLIGAMTLFYVWWQGRVRIKIEICTIPSESGCCLRLTVLNVGKIQVYLKDAGFQIGRTESSIIEGCVYIGGGFYRLPKDLPQGKPFVAFLQASKLLEQLEQQNNGLVPRKITIWISDAIGRRYEKKLNGRRFMATLKRVAESENFGFGPLRDPIADQ